MDTGVIIWIITILLCGGFMVIAFRQKGNAEVSFSNYAIGGGMLPFFLIFFSHFANIMGVGNFVGHAGSAYMQGLPWLVFILGEQGSKIIFAFAFAGLAGRFVYNTYPEMIDDLITRDKVTRALAGVLASCIMIAWVGGQGKAFGAVFEAFTGINPLPIIIFFTAVFVVYTALGGIYSLVWMDFIQGLVCVVFGALFYIIAFKKVNFSIAEIGVRLNQIGRGDLWGFSSTNAMGVITKFVTGCIGILVAQLYWQPSFAAKNPRTAKRSMLIGGASAIVYVMLTAMVGLIIATMNQGLDANNTMVWFMQNEVPQIVAVGLFVLILAAGMSSADSNLNAASILITNDLVKPFSPNLTDKGMIKLARILTVVIGVLAALGAIFAESIMSLFSRAYSMAGSGLVPLLVIGLIWKERKGEAFEMGKRNSKVTPWGARCSIVVGSVLSQMPFMGSNAVVWALLIASATLIIVSILTRNVPLEKGAISSGFTGVNTKELPDEATV